MTIMIDFIKITDMPELAIANRLGISVAIINNVKLNDKLLTIGHVLNLVNILDKEYNVKAKINYNMYLRKFELERVNND